MPSNNENRINIEQSFINLLLNHKDLVAEWLNNSGLKISCFDTNHKIILLAIEDSYKNNALLTKDHFYHFAKQYAKNYSDLNNQTFLYDKISIFDATRDNFELYKNQIKERHITESAIKYIEKFRNALKEKSSIESIKDLSKEISDLSTDITVDKMVSGYSSIHSYAEEFLDIVKRKRSGDIESDVIKCGIREIDESMVIGFAPGTLTLICADVANYKCAYENEICQIQDGSYITFKEIYDRIKNNEEIFILSINDDKKVYLQKIYNVVKNGIQTVYEVKTKYGFSVKMTGNHPFLTKNGYKDLLKLNIGEQVAISKYGVFGKEDASEINIVKASYTSILNNNIDKSIYKWNRDCLSAFLSSIFYYCGHFNKNSKEIIYSFSSINIAIDIRNLLLKFGIFSKLLVGVYSDKKEYELIINEDSNIASFIQNITCFPDIEWITLFFENIDKTYITDSDIYWDEVVSITNIGQYETYDVCMPTDHNFVANNFITHNSTMMMNIAMNIWQGGNNVLFVPLEMPKEKMYQKFLSRYSEIPFKKIEYPSMMTDEEMTKIEEYTKKLSEPTENKFFMMETYDRIPVSVIRREIEKHIDIFKPRLVVIDYIANLTKEASEQKEREDLAIGNMLKSLRAMGRPGAIHDKGFAILTAAQIGRDALKRVRRTANGKLAFYSEDLRNSHEYSADSDNIYAQMIDEAQPNSRLMIFPIKCRYGEKTFANNENKAVLEIVPEIGLIRSIRDEWMVHDKEDIMNKVNDISIDDDSLDFGNDEALFVETSVNNNETCNSDAQMYKDIEDEVSLF